MCKRKKKRQKETRSIPQTLFWRLRKRRSSSFFSSSPKLSGFPPPRTSSLFLPLPKATKWPEIRGLAREIGRRRKFTETFFRQLRFFISFAREHCSFHCNVDLGKKNLNNAPLCDNCFPVESCLSHGVTC